MVFWNVPFIIFSLLNFCPPSDDLCGGGVRREMLKKINPISLHFTKIKNRYTVTILIRKLIDYKYMFFFNSIL